MIKRVGNHFAVVSAPSDPMVAEERIRRNHPFLKIEV